MILFWKTSNYKKIKYYFLTIFSDFELLVVRMVYNFVKLKNQLKMKKTFFAVSTALSLFLASCGGDKATSNATASSSSSNSQAESKFNLDTSVSVLKWKGSKTEEDFHIGSLKFKSGSLSASGTENVSGEFVINMNTIKVEDEKLPNDKKEMLKGHLGKEDYFNVSKFPEVTVKVNGYKDGKLTTVISVLGKEMKQEIPVKLTNDGKKATIAGPFEIDFKELNLKGLKVNEEKPEETINSLVKFELNLVLNK